MRPALAVPAVMSTALKGRTHGRTDQCCKREEYSCQLGAVHKWHKADNPRVATLVRFQSKQRRILAFDGFPKRML